jgi:hypothetical protein
MAWERRGKGKYYYRSLRVNGRVVKEYVGAGPAAEEIAKLDADARRMAAAEKAAWREKMAKYAEITAMIIRLNELSDLLIAVTMCAAGYHKPNRGPWRKKRRKPGVTAPPSPQPANDGAPSGLAAPPAGAGQS